MAKRKKPAETRSWIVRLKRVVIVEVVCDDCTEEQARDKTFDFSNGDEQDVDSYTDSVLEVRPNE